MEPRATFHPFDALVEDAESRVGEWDHFLYVGKIAFFGWFFHFGMSLTSSR